MNRLRWFDYLSINLFWLGLNIRNTAVGTFFMPFLVDTYAPADWKNTALSAMRTAGLIIAMLVQPAAGLVSDRSTSRFGRRRPFILIGALLDLVFLAAIGLSWNYWSLLVAVLLIQFSSNISHGPLQGLIPDRVPEDQRGKASAVKAIFELLPIVLVGISIAPLVGSGHLVWAIVATGAGLLIAALVTIVWVKEQPLKEKPDIPFWPPMLRVLGMLAGILMGAAAGLVGGGLVGGLAGLVTWLFAGRSTGLAVMVGLGGTIAMIIAVVMGVWAGSMATIGKEARQHSSFIWWIINRLLFLAAITSIQGFALYFLEFAFKITSEEAAKLTGNLVYTVGIFTLLSALPAGWLADRIGHKLLVSVSGIIATVGGSLLLGTIWIPNLSLIYVAGIVLGVGTGLFMTVNWAMGTSLVPPGEAGRYLGISNLAGAGAGMIGAGIGGPMADYLNLTTPGLGYFAIFAAYAVLFALSVVSLRFIHEIKPATPAPLEEETRLALGKP
ncbi:MAG TPA: MFS transporter [Anaerolineales bacterium]|nr:MFS transporter [Anaerolineales bacterium]